MRYIVRGNFGLSYKKLEVQMAQQEAELSTWVMSWLRDTKFFPQQRSMTPTNLELSSG